MIFTDFRIENFKGISKAGMNLASKHAAKIFCLVGLNESGKTTILQAINGMGRKPYDLTQVDPSKSRFTRSEYQSYIPVSKRYNFTGDIKLIATLRFSEEDKTKTLAFMRDTLGLKVIHLQDEFKITKTISYVDSKYDKVFNWWTLTPKVKAKRGKKEYILDTNSGEKLKAQWLKLAEFVEPMIPQILYFKNEVFDIPDRILISTGQASGSPDKSDDAATVGKKGRQSINEFYYGVIQDILFSIDSDLTIEKHIAKRKLSSAPQDKKALEGVLQKMGQHVTKTVIAQWEQIFRRKLDDKRIQFVCEVAEKSNVYIHLKIEDGGEIFDISERSTGFRWFLVFILLTHYRGFRNEAAVFLYDEPASNLHASAQKQLLECFSNLPDNFRVIYSTHSHYLINPEWLESTLIVKNEAVSYAPDELDFNLAKTDIKLIPYRQFVSSHPKALNYFQPVLEVLNYVPSDLEGTKPVVLVEGKSDYYLLAYLINVCMSIELAFDLIPCMGSGTADELIALYAGWGKQFVVLLDGDRAGEKERRRYLDKFGLLVQDRIATYSDINSTWNKHAIEKIVDEPDRLTIQTTVFPETHFSKATFHLAVQELLAKRKPLAITSISSDRIKLIIQFVEKKLGIS